jgi:undecaprenyl-diphosphatase
MGDGVFWYALMALLPLLYGERGIEVAFQMMLAGLVGLALYRSLKARLARERPRVSQGIVRGAAPLDRYSFPSGHTLHAVSFSMLVIAEFPELTVLCALFTVLVAMSRVILGLHYPTDVLAGALIGGTLSSATIFLLPGSG